MPNVKVQQKVTELQGYLDNLSEGFGRLESAIHGSAEQSGKLKSSFQGFSKALEEIQTFSQDLKTTLDSIVPQVKSGTQFNTNADQTIFSAYGKLVDVIVNSIDNSKLAKFQTVAKSVKAFSSSLKDIVTFSKEYGGDKFSKLVETLNTKEGTNTKSKILDFINNFLPEGDALETLNKNIEGVNSVVNAVRKYVSALRGLVSTGTKDIEIPEEWHNARQRFYNFLRGFGLEGDVPDALTRLDTLTKTIGKYISALMSLQRFGKEGGIDTESWDKVRLAFYTFLRGFKLEGDVPDALKRLDTLTKAVGKYITIIAQLQRFGKAGGIDTESWDRTRLAFYDFIRGFGTEGDVSASLDRLNQLTKGMLKYNSILTTLSRTGSASPETVKSWNDTRLEFYNFLRGFSTDGDVPDVLKRVNQLMAGISKYAQVLNTLQRVGSVGTEDVTKWNETRQAFYDFLRGFGTGGDVKDSYERLNKLVAGMYKYAQVLNTLQRVGAVDANATGAWETTRQEIIKFIESFKSQGTSTDEELDKAAARANKLMTGISKYADVLRTLKSVGSEMPDLNALNNVRGEVFKFINDFGETGVKADDEKLNKSATRASKLMTGLAKYADVLRTLQRIGEIDVNKDPDKWKNTKDAVFGFISLFEHKGTDADDKLDDAGKRANKLMTGISKYADVIRALQSVGDVGNTVPDAWKNTQTAILEFIKGFQATGVSGKQRVDDEAIDKGAERIDRLMKGLTKYATAVQGLQKIGDIGSKVPGFVPNSWIDTRNAIMRFIKGFGATGNTAIDEPLNNAAERMNDLVKGLTKYANAVRGLQSIGRVKLDDPQKWEEMRTSVFDFIRGFKDSGTPADTELKNAADRLNELMKGMVKYANVVKSLQKIGRIKTTDFADWTATKDAFITFINSFQPATQADADKLNSNVKLVEDIGKSLQKFASVAKTMFGLTGFDPNTMATNLNTFISELVKAVKNPALTSISKDLQKKFSGIANSFKGISSFINSMTKGSFANFAPNLQKAIPLLKLFIEETAKLTKLSSFPDFERVANAVGKFNGKLQDMNKTVNQSSKAMTKLHSLMRQIYTAFVGGAVVYSIVRTIKSAIKEMFNLEYAMARVNTIARVSSAELKNMTHFVQSMSATYGVASSKVTKALYDINSATIKGSSSLKILEQSVKLAVAGFTDVEKVSDLIAKAVNAYEYSASEASKISDILFVTVERGINPMEELSEYFGRLFTVSANAGVSLEEVGAGLATLTARGYQTNVASTALNSAILKLSTGTKELNKLFQQYGYASSASALRTIGLSGALQILNKATNGATEKLHDLGFNYRDIRAATTLASGAISEYNKTLDLMTDKNYTANKTAEALAKVQDTVKYKVDQLKETYTVFVQSIAEYLDKNKEIKDFLDILKDSFEAATKAMRGLNLTFTEQLGAGFVNLIPKLIATYGIFRLLNPILLKSGNLFRGFYLVHKLAPNATLTLRGIFIGLKGIGSALQGVLGSLGTAMKWLVVVQGSIEVISRLVNTIKDGNFWSGFMDLTGFDALFKGDISGYFKTMYANYKGLQGSLIDAFTGFSTDFGSQWRNEIKQADVVDKEAIRKGEQYQALMGVWQANHSNKLPVEELKSILKQYASVNNISDYILNAVLKNVNKIDIGKTVRDAISGLRNIELSEINGASLIQEEYDKWMDKIHNMGTAAGFSSEELQELTKRLTNERDTLLGLNKEFTDLQPNLKALNDVFEVSKKEIEKNYEKNAGPLQKAFKNINEVEEATQVLVEGFGLSAEQIAVYFANPANYAEFEDMIHGGIKNFAEQINDVLGRTLRKGAFTPKKITVQEAYDSGQLNELINTVWKETVKAKGFKNVASSMDTKTLKDWFSGKVDVLAQAKRLYPIRDEFGRSHNIEVNADASVKQDFIDAFKNKFNELVPSVVDVLNENLRDKHIQKHFKEITKALSDSGLFDKDSITKLQNSQAVFNEFKKQYDEIQKNPEKLINVIGDAVSNITPKMRAAIQIVASGTAEASKDADSFVKQMATFSNTMSKLSSSFNVRDVISNQLMLPEVDAFKKKIRQSLGLVNDNGELDYLITEYAEDMARGLSPEELQEKYLSKFRVAFKLKINDSVIKNTLGVMLDQIVNMAKAYEDFERQINKFDYLKHFYKTKNGVEMTAFDKYKAGGGRLIEAVENSFINTKTGQSIRFKALYDEFNSYLEKGMGFEQAEKIFSIKYGSDAFKKLYNKFKEFDGYVKEFVKEINELDFIKFVNRLKFGSEMSAFKQFKEVDSKKIAEILGRKLVNGIDVTFKDVFEYAIKYGNEATEQMLLREYGDRGKQIFNQYKNTLPEYETTMKGSPFALQSQYKNIKKQVHQFIKNYEDAFLTSMQQFEKVQSKLNRQFAKIKSQMEEGYVNPTLVTRYLENLEKLQKLNEEVMNIKVPATITASEAVKFGSKEAFDMIATNIFRDTYKVNVEQKNLQKQILEQAKKVGDYVTKSSNKTSGIVTNKGVIYSY